MNCMVSVPLAARYLGFLGAIPFITLCFLGFFLEGSHQVWVHFALAAYGAVILSFLGGIHWGIGVADKSCNGATFFRLGCSVVPSLVGWGALLFSRPVGLLVLAIAFLGMLAFDFYTIRNLQGPVWYLRLRWPLTIVVVVSLMIPVLT